jgi:23S rRNA (guanine745-N1)-methyltransferase
MLIDVLRHLRCPVCGGALTEATAGTARALRCASAHSFDIARHGYVHLGGPRMPHVGDTSAMVAARDDFLAGGHFDFISTALRALVDHALVGDGIAPLVVDAGAGTGHHLAALLEALPGAAGLALDVSRPALRRAARAHPRMAAVLCDTYGRLPLADASAHVLLNVFAPRNGAEFRRVLREDGALLVVTPAVEHLHELVLALGLLSVDPSKSERLDASLGDDFEREQTTREERVLQLTQREVEAVVAMGPSAWHIHASTLAHRVAALPEPVAATAAVNVTRYRPRDSNR